MSANSLLGSLRELQVLVLNPPGEVSDALVSATDPHRLFGTPVLAAA
ncbi:hypothetical protein PA7078_02538 [Pseudomonas aeruginosa]